MPQYRFVCAKVKFFDESMRLFFKISVDAVFLLQKYGVNLFFLTILGCFMTKPLLFTRLKTGKIDCIRLTNIYFFYFYYSKKD
jgi:hypothetical protein